MKNYYLKNFIVLSIFFLSLGSSFAQDSQPAPYQSNSLPPNDLILKKASEKAMSRCKKNITEIIGRFAASENLYQIFYHYKEREKIYYDNEITLYRFDDKKWFMVCGDSLGGKSAGIVNK